MRSVFRRLLVVGVAALALAAAMASGASAHEFLVEGKGVTGSEAFTGISNPVTIHSINPNLVGSCSDYSTEGELLSGGKSSAEVLVNKCVFTSPANCVGSIGMSTVGQLEKESWSQTELVMNHVGSGSHEYLGQMELSGGSCVLAGKYSLYGHWSCELPEAETLEKRYHEEVCKRAHSRIEWGNSVFLELSNSPTLGLSSGKYWSMI